MIQTQGGVFGVLLLMCVEWFLYGIYTGIFAIYLQCVSKQSRTATIILYALCLLYSLSTAAVVCDLLTNILQMRIYTLPIQLQFDSQPILFRILIVQSVVNGFCEFIARCTLIYRCWIVWGKNFGVMIIPSFLAITFITSWIASEGFLLTLATHLEYGESFNVLWATRLILTCLAVSMAINALVTGLIVFKILKVFLEVKTTSVERTLGSTGGTKLRHIIFIIIESGVALFTIQLIRVVISSLIELGSTSPGLTICLQIVIVIHEMLNGIAPTIILVRVRMGLSFDDEESFKETTGNLKFNNPPSDTSSLQRVGSSSNMLPQEGNDSDEDISFDNRRVPSDPSIILQVRRVPVGSSSSTLVQERRQ